MSDLINKIVQNLQQSSDHYGTFTTRKMRDMEIVSGNFWTEKEIDACDRTGRICRTFNFYDKFANAIVSPFSKSPYHAEIEDEEGIYSSIQSAIDDIENTNEAKYVFTQAVRDAAYTGVGYFILSTSDGKIMPEIVKNISQVALDPNVQELNGSDAEWGAIVNYISISKAKRLYGDDVVNRDGTSRLSSFGAQWTVPSNSVAIITYYELNSSNTVDMYKICGNKIIKQKVKDELVDNITLNISRIPIFRVCFNEVLRAGKFDYRGIVDMTADLQFGINVGYSTLLERANRTAKANFMMPAKAIEGLDEFYRKLHSKESLVCLYNGDVAPTQIIEQYQTQDLMQTIQQCSDLMAQTIGVPNGGINPAMNSQTATEILVQQNNAESNVNSLYENAQSAIFSFCRCVIELLCWQEGIDKLPTFKLINGPSIITKLMKRRQELLAVSSLVDEKTRKIIAKQYIETLDADVKDSLNADLIANSPEIMWVSDSTQKEDPIAVNTLNQMNAVLEETQDELERQIAANAQLKNEIDNLQLQMLNMKEQHLLDYQKQQQDFAIEQAKLQLEAEKVSVDAGVKLEASDAKAAIEDVKLQKELIDLESKKLDIVNKAIGG